MKKLLLFLTAIFFSQSFAFAQFTNLWKKIVNGDATTGYTWLNNGANINNVASLAYNPATDKLLVSNRNTNVYIINAATGAQEGTLSTVGLGGESFKFNKIRVDANGVIYGISLATGSPWLVKIYRWANQAADPVLCASFNATERCGDSFGLSGTGTNTVLYASGAGVTANAFNIYILNTTDGSAFTLESQVTMASSPTAGQQWSNRVVEPVGTGVNSDIWIKGGGFTAKRISVSAPTAGVRTGTVVTTIADGVTGGQASINYGGMRYITGTARKFLVFMGGNNAESGTVMRALNVTNEAAIALHGTDALYPTTSYVTNSNGSGDVSFRVNSDGSFTTFYLSTNNGIGATTSAAEALPVSLTNFNAALAKGQSTLTWETASESNNKGFQVLRSTDGKDFAKIDFVASKAQNGNSASALSYSYVDRTAKAGINYYKLNQVDLDGKSELFEKAVSVNVSLSGADVVVFPNPATSYVSVNAGSADYKDVKYELFDAVGKKVMSEKAKAEQQDISLSKLPASVYYLKISKAGEVQKTVKLIKQ